MNELVMIENELVPVYETSTGEKVVYGTELHEVLEVKSRFNDWIRNRLTECDAIEKEDFESFTKNLVKGGRPTIEYVIKLDIAKEMAMLERNDKGKQVRRYFIQIEKKYKQVLKPLTQLEILQQSIEVLERHETEIKKIDNRMDKLENDIPLYGSEADELSNHVKRKGVAVLGGKKSNAYKDINIRYKVYRDIYNQIKREFDIYGEDGKPKSYKALKRKYLADAHELIDVYEVPLCIAELIDYANSQINLEIA
nr:MAG TPA: AntA/AntB antirepressor [Caudoviricetes sp.]